MDSNKMLKQAQEMQEKVQEMKDKLKNVKADGTSGGGLVIATMNGSNELVSIKIDDKVFKEEKGVLEDLIVAAINNAKKAVESKTQEEMSKLTGDLKLPPGIKLPF